MFFWCFSKRREGVIKACQAAKFQVLAAARRSTKLKAKLKYRFGGVSISGGRSDKACLTVIEYYPDQKRIFIKNF